MYISDSTTSISSTTCLPSRLLSQASAQPCSWYWAANQTNG